VIFATAFDGSLLRCSLVGDMSDDGMTEKDDRLVGLIIVTLAIIGLFIFVVLSAE
jgi:hypothetical protein